MLPPGAGFSKAQLCRGETSCLPGGGDLNAARLIRCGTSAHRSKLDQGFFVRAADPAARRLECWAMTILKWALIFFLVSIVAGILGFTGVSAASADIASFLFYVFVVIFLVLLILGLTIFRV
jgi:uncharacterized membrane protein YtjA (UPF0391 family)